MQIINTTRLCKTYGPHRVLQDVDLSVQAGKLVGFLGPNGAGKTTTIRILLGLLESTSGTAEIFGRQCKSEGKRIREEVGYLPGDVHFYPSMTGGATLKYFARVRRRDCDREIKRLAERLELPLVRSVRKYSTGMRQKLGLIQSLMHRPDLLILDEPTSALDPLIRTQVFEELKDVIKSGRSVLFSSHSLNEVEELCDEVVILRDGKIVEHQSIEVLRGRALRRVTLVFKQGCPVPTDVPEHFQIIERADSRFVGTWSGPIESLLAWLRSLTIDDVIVERPDLSDLFLTYYSESNKTVANRLTEEGCE